MQQYPFDKTWWIDGKRMMGGQYPGDPDVEKHRRMLQALLDAGASCFINLQMPDDCGSNGQPFRDYVPLVEGLCATRGIRVFCRRFGIGDQKTPDPLLMNEILDCIDQSLQDGLMPYIHCWGGNGRTGTVVGCWLIRHGRTPEEAFDEMSQERSGRGFRYPAPENNRQRQFVEAWAELDSTLRSNTVQRETSSKARLARPTQNAPRHGTWFEQLVGFRETNPDEVRQQLSVDGSTMTAVASGIAMQCGTLTTPSLAELREQVQGLKAAPQKLAASQVVANVQDLHADPANANAMFQVASQFNLLEMTGPSITPEQGVGRYEKDHTQGPACAIAAGPGTIYRNYFVELENGVGQTQQRQIDCLAEIGTTLGNSDERLWRIQNGYVMPAPGGLDEIQRALTAMGEEELDALRGQLRVGLHRGTQVTLRECTHLVSQIYCSALPVAYNRFPTSKWEAFARLVLEASYEATLCAAILNHHHCRSRDVFLTLLGGGAFGNPPEWILDSIKRAMRLHSGSGLNVVVVSYGKRDRGVDRLVSGSRFS